MAWLTRLGVRSNARALANARSATTALSRQRVERGEVALFLHRTYADLGGATTPRTDSRRDAVATEVAR